MAGLTGISREEALDNWNESRSQIASVKHKANLRAPTNGSISGADAASQMKELREANKDLNEIQVSLLRDMTLYALY